MKNNNNNTWLSHGCRRQQLPSSYNFGHIRTVSQACALSPRACGEPQAVTWLSSACLAKPVLENLSSVDTAVENRFSVSDRDHQNSEEEVQSLSFPQTFGWWEVKMEPQTSLMRGRLGLTGTLNSLTRRNSFLYTGNHSPPSVHRYVPIPVSDIFSLLLPFQSEIRTMRD